MVDAEAVDITGYVWDLCRYFLRALQSAIQTAARERARVEWKRQRKKKYSQESRNVHRSWNLGEGWSRKPLHESIIEAQQSRLEMKSPQNIRASIYYKTGGKQEPQPCSKCSGGAW